MSFVPKDPPDRRREISGFLMLALTTLLFLALITDDYQGAAQRSLEGMAAVPNRLGVAGAVVTGVSSILVGPASHVLYFLTCVWGIMLIRHRPVDRIPTRLLGAFALTASVAGLLHVNLAPHTDNPTPGGAFGAFMGGHLLALFGAVGANIVAGTLAIIGILLATEFLFLQIFELLRGLGRTTWRVLGLLYRAGRALYAAHRERVLRRRRPFREIAQRILGANADLPEEDEESLETPAFSGYSQDGGKALQADLEDLSRIQVRTTGPAMSPAEDDADGPALAQQDLPFDADPEPLPAIDDADPVAVEAVGDEEPFSEDVDEAVPEAPVADEAECPAAEDGDFVEDYEALTPFTVMANAEEIDEELPNAGAVPADAEPADEAPVSIEEVLAAETPPEPAKPVLRCKTAVMDELPPGYQYPRVYTEPPIDLFDPAPHEPATADISDQLRQISVRLEETLETFGIEARVTEVLRGPTITRFELQPAPGIKVSRFHALADDIALALKAQGVRVEAPIPGKGRVGIEVPNKERQPVVMRELLESAAFKHSDHRLKLVLGKDIAGDVIQADLTTMPHLLVAGATGAGKTVCVKSFLASLLHTMTPDELDLILIDPKMVELSIFNDIPHLITPVVVDPKKASTALNWLINEMEERYRLFAHLRVRNIDVYNERVENGEIEMVGCGSDASESITVNRKLPYIVCVIDELADLMMQARAEVEDAIARLAQLARATGIHLIIATQRPSVDVLTGVIKANFPARMSFQVSSRVDSRCILDEIGAERLIGMGDLLYLPAGRSKPLRIQGAFVSDQEMERLIAHLKRQAPPQYRDEIEQFGQTKGAQEDLLEETDELFDDAVRVVMDTGQASISMVQRRLRVGYTRAARLIDMMELKGIVGPHTGSKAREILVGAPRRTDEVA